MQAIPRLAVPLSPLQTQVGLLLSHWASMNKAMLSVSRGFCFIRLSDIDAPSVDLQVFNLVSCSYLLYPSSLSINVSSSENLFTSRGDGRFGCLQYHFP